MDPNETLRELRAAMELRDSVDNTDAWSTRPQDLFRALDRWLSNGGFLPVGWQRGCSVACDRDG